MRVVFLSCILAVSNQWTPPDWLIFLFLMFPQIQFVSFNHQLCIIRVDLQLQYQTPASVAICNFCYSYNTPSPFKDSYNVCNKTCKKVVKRDECLLY